MMRLELCLSGCRYQVHLDRPVSLGIPVDFSGPQPSFFGAPRAEAAALELPGFIGDTRRGGSCNVAELRLVPHCNGTHTETVGHLVHQAAPVGETLAQTLFPARLISVAPCRSDEAGEAGVPPGNPQDRVISRGALEERLHSIAREELEALVVRTAPNNPSKRHRDYGAAEPPPFFTAQAMRYVIERGVQHLLVDLPSIDAINNERLGNHRLFWEMSGDRWLPGRGTAARKTVTEMIYVPEEVPDGLYLLDLQVPAFLSDAAPSRPIVYPLTAHAGAGRGA